MPERDYLVRLGDGIVPGTWTQTWVSPPLTQPDMPGFITMTLRTVPRRHSLAGVLLTGWIVLEVLRGR